MFIFCRHLISAAAVGLAATLLLLACTAAAATRYAAPGGTGKDPCVNPSRPCSVFTAADQNAPRTTIKPGDVVELAPGTYRAEDEGEFGEIAGVLLPQGVIVRGEPGKARPAIVVLDNEAGYGAFHVPTASEVADVAIHNRSGHGAAVTVSGGTIERVIARSATGEPACYFHGGTVRNSACIASGGGSPAIGDNGATKGTVEGVFRNSTFIATGPGSVGMEFIYYAFKRGLTVNIDATGVLVEGEEKDVVVKAWPLNKGRGAIVDVDLRNSSYETVETEAKSGGRAAVTRPGTNGNVTASPLLADDLLHQLPGSPTIDTGAADGANSALDVDGQPRTLGAAVDIGADEFASIPAQSNSAPATRLAPPWGKGLLLTPLRKTKFRFGSNDINPRFECKLDRRPYRGCTSPYEVKVKLGKHEFRVRAVDPQGIADPTPAVARWQVLPWRVFQP
jgi:hypothetical protein